MSYRARIARVNVKLLVILIVVTVGLGVSLVAARQIRRKILSKRDFEAGTAAFAQKDWATAYEHFVEYLGRNPDDAAIWKKCAQAKLAVRPFKMENVWWTIGAYRRVLQMDPNDEEAFDELASFYAGLGDFSELAFIAEKRHERVPDDRDVLLTYAEAQIGLGEYAKVREALLDFFGDPNAPARSSAGDFVETGDDIPDVKEARKSPIEKFLDAVEHVALEKHKDYERACLLISNLVTLEDANEPMAKALEWLNKALDAAPDQAAVLARRAQFYRAVAVSSESAAQAAVLKVDGLSDDDARERLLELARKDLQTVDSLQTDDPKMLYFLGSEWLVHNDLDAAEAELEALDELTQEKLDEHFLDPNDWAVKRFDFAANLLAAQLWTVTGRERQQKALEGASLADTMRGLTETWHQIRAFPVAIPMYLHAAEVLRDQGQLEASHARVADANECLATYREALLLQKKEDIASPAEVAWLTAKVAQAQGKPYEVINAAQPIVAMDPSNVKLCRLLAEAYSQTRQPRRAVHVLQQCAERRPQDAALARQLASQYFKLGDWENARKMMEAAGAGVPGTDVAADISIELLRIAAQLSTIPAQNTDEVVWDALSRELERLREAHPEKVDVRIFQAIVADHRGRPEEAEAVLKQAIEECDSPLPARMQLVYHYRSTRRVAEAIATCQEACQEHPNASEPWLELAALHVSSGDPNAGRAALETGLATVSEGSRRDLSIDLAIVELSVGNKRTYRDILQELVKADESDIETRILLLDSSIIGLKTEPNDLPAEELIADLRRIEGETGLQWRYHQADSWLRDANDATASSKVQPAIELLQYCVSADPGWSAPVLLLGQTYEGLGNYEDAISVYQAGLVHDSSATVVAHRLMALLVEQGRFTEADAVFDQVRVNPRFVSSWQTQMELRGGDVSRAIDRLKQSLGQQETLDGEALVQLARLTYKKTGQADEAFTYLEKARAIDPNLRTLAAVEASIWRDEGQPDKMRDVLNDYVKRTKGSFEAYAMRAVFLAEMATRATDQDTAANCLDDAQQDYEKLTTFDKQGAIGYILLSRFYAQREHFGTAEERLDKAIAVLEEADPKDSSIKRELMLMLFQRDEGQDRQQATAILSDLEANPPQELDLMMIRAKLLLEDPNQTTPEDLARAEEKLREIVRREPRAVDAHLGLIHIALQRGEYATARDLAIRALGFNAGNADLLLARARAELPLGNDQVAQDLAELVLHDDPNNAVAAKMVFGSRMLRAGRLYLNGNIAMAKALYRDLLAEDPNQIRVLNDLAWVLQEHDQSYEEALKLANRGLQFDPNSVHLLDTRGTILTKMPNRLTDATRDFERIIALSSTDQARQAKTHAQLARLYAGLGDKAKAKKHAEKALQIDQKVAVLDAQVRDEIGDILK